MSIEQLVKDLGINKVGTYGRDRSYVIDLDSSDEFGKVYSKLDKNDDLDYLDDSSTLTVDNSNLRYRYGKEFQLALMADFKYDNYKLVISEI